MVSWPNSHEARIFYSLRFMAYTVYQITNYIKNMFSQDFVLRTVKVTGEISNCKYSSTGHIYFTLKDSRATLSCIMFASDASKLNTRLENGLEIEAEGRIDVFERDGVYQLYVKKVTQSGEGALYERFMALKAELEERGMFAPEYKRPIPKYIKTLGVVTAATGAAVRDIIQIASRRNPYVQIILYPSLVQGDGAAASIVSGIHALEAIGVDVMIVGRGGGSIEDLWAFNEEIVAEAIFNSEIPVISAVGHETDFTIADFVSDLRAPTPSAAAELAVFEVERLFETFEYYNQELTKGVNKCIQNNRNKANALKLQLSYLSPENQIRTKRTFAISLEEKLNTLMRTVINKKKHELDMYISSLKGLSPLDKLSLGYSVALDENKKKIKSINDVNVSDHINLYVKDGYIKAVVEEVDGNS